MMPSKASRASLSGNYIWVQCTFDIQVAVTLDPWSDFGQRCCRLWADLLWQGLSKSTWVVGQLSLTLRMMGLLQQCLFQTCTACLLLQQEMSR